MDFKIIDDLMAQLGIFLNTYYYYAIAGGVILTIIIVIIVLKFRLKKAKGKDGKTESSSDLSSVALQLLIGSNPEILNQMVDEKAKKKEKIIEEIKKFSKIKDFKKINDSTAEITVEIDGEEHWYRAKTTEDGHKPRILSLNKIK